MPGNRYCVHCAANGDRQTCILPGGRRCSVGTIPLQYCSSLNPQGSTDGPCSLYIAPGGGVRLVYRSTLTTAPRREAEETNTDAKCPAACTHAAVAANKYCVHCSPARDRMTCMAAGGMPCMTSYQDGSNTYPKQMQLCTSVGTVRAPDGVCYGTIDAGSPSVTLKLQPTGKGVAFAAAMAYDCTGKLERARDWKPCCAAPSLTKHCGADALIC